MLKSKFKEPIPLHHTPPCNLINPGARLQFLRDFIAVVRCLADGTAPLAYLWQDGGNVRRKIENEDIYEKSRNGGKTLRRTM